MTAQQAAHWLQHFEARLKDRHTEPDMRRWYAEEIAKLKARLSHEQKAKA